MMTTEQRNFVDAYLETGHATRAVMKLYPEMPTQRAGAIAAVHMRNPGVQNEISLAHEAARVVSTLTALERRQWVADLVRVDPRNALASAPHVVQSIDVTRRILETGEVEERIKVKLPDKLRAIEVDAKLDGVALEGDDDTSLLIDGIAELMGVTVRNTVDEDEFEGAV